MNRLYLALLACLFPLIASYSAPDGMPVSAHVDDIYEAVFRYQLTHNASGQKTNAGVFFLSITNSDPSEAFMQRFEGNTPPVKKASMASHDATTVVVDPETKVNGLILRVDGIRWLSSDRVEVEGGYYEAGDSSSGNTYYLEQQDGKWIVTNDVMHWISKNTEPSPPPYGSPAACSPSGEA